MNALREGGNKISLLHLFRSHVDPVASTYHCDMGRLLRENQKQVRDVITQFSCRVQRKVDHDTIFTTSRLTCSKL